MKYKKIIVVLKVIWILYNSILGFIGGLGLLFSNITIFNDTGNDVSSLFLYLIILFIGNIVIMLLCNKIINEYITLWDFFKFSVIPYIVSLIIPFLIYNIIYRKTLKI